MHDLWKIARAVYDVEEATSTAFEIILGHKVYLFSPSFHPSGEDLLFIFLVICPLYYLQISLFLCMHVLPDDQIKYTGFISEISSTFGGSSSF